MTSNIRDFKNFRDVPGNVNNNVFEFPPLYSLDKANRKRIWRQFIRLIPKELSLINYEHNWDINDPKYNKCEPITDALFDSINQIPINIVAQIYSEMGIIGMKISRNIPTIINGPSSGLIGKANARNTFTQALINARSIYLKKIDDGYTCNINVNIANKTKRYYAMAAAKYEDNMKSIIYPCNVQPKLDGVRCIMCLENNKIAKYSRELNDWIGYDESFDTYLFPLFKKYPTLHLDGEFYSHGKKLQEITGVARNEVKKFQLEYWIFDLFFTDQKDMLYIKRNCILLELFNIMNKMPNWEQSHIKYVETFEVNNALELDNYYKLWLKNKFEGEMIRLNAVYEFSQNGEIRSKSLLKRKKKYDGIRNIYWYIYYTR
jgi:hypothetical protein